MTDNVINIRDYFGKKEVKDDVEYPLPSLPQFELSAGTLAFMRNTIGILREESIDPMEDEVSVDVILLCMLFTALVKRTRGEHDNMYDFFGDMKLMVFGDFGDGDDQDE